MGVEPIAHRHATTPPDEHGRYLHRVVQQHADERFTSVRAFANVLVVNDRGDCAGGARIVIFYDESADASLDQGNLSTEGSSRQSVAGSIVSVERIHVRVHR